MDGDRVKSRRATAGAGPREFKTVLASRGSELDFVGRVRMQACNRRLMRRWVSTGGGIIWIIGVPGRKGRSNWANAGISCALAGQVVKKRGVVKEVRERAGWGQRSEGG